MRRGKTRTLASMFGRSKKPGQLEKLFSEYLSPHMMRALESDAFQDELNEPEGARIEFVLAAVQGSSAGDVGRKMGEVSDVAMACGWTVETLVSGTVLAISGPFPWSLAQPAISRGEFVARLRKALGSDLKTVHGVEHGYFGSFGSERRKTWGTYLPGFQKSLTDLCISEYGQDLDKGAG